MGSMGMQPFAIVHTIITVVWVILNLALAAAFVFRFRKTGAGIAGGGAFLLLALARILHSVIRFAVMKFTYDPMITLMLLDVLFTLVYSLITVILAVGVAMIPMSLRKLAAGAA